MSASPSVTVLMAVYNGERFLREGVDSILSQSYTDFELLVVDDASTDSTPSILEQYHDPRLRVLRNNVNVERCVSRNRGLNEARGDLVAVMDADDYSLPHRLARQVAFMNGHPEVTVCGSFYEIYETGKIIGPPQTSASIRTRMLFENPLAHPSVMLRKAPVLVLTGGYDPISPYAEDYNLWVRLAEHGNVGFANIPETLLRYRVHPDSLSRAGHSRDRDMQVDRARARLLGHLLGSVSEEDLEIHLALADMPISSLPILPRCIRWPRRLRAANARTGVFAPQALDAELRYRLRRLPTQFLKSLLPGRAYLRVFKWWLQRLVHQFRAS
jgi:glycosyltransferase involved in cell wall biosynthesis